MPKDPYKLNRNTYNSLAKQYQDKFMNWDGYHKTYDTFLATLTSEPTTLLEIGCGPGNVTRYLLQKRPGLKIHGIDISPNMIALAKQNNTEASFEVMDCRAIDSLEQRFDAIMCGFCIPYINKEDAIQLIQHAASLIEANGIFYLSNMEETYGKSGLKGSPNHDLEVFIYFHEAEYLMEALSENGFELMHEIRQDYPEQDGSNTTDLFLIARKK
ncbi:MAG: 2-polyprenyl-3-methyl-5-hydroxy-6-metoxy-1,4-benzoquinol methylase [Candidatus Latescibacterota bacterium]|jgi:2-polyprenyl-3-methyl-5-hydroxy-6-metoxy-1,4-benzoquinol methylase